MLGKNLKTLRKIINKTQEEVAKDLCLHKSTYKNYELGLREPDIDTLKKLADYFHTTVDHLIDHDVPYLINKSKFSNEQLEIINGIEPLNKEQCNRVLSYIDGLKDGKKDKIN